MEQAEPVQMIPILGIPLIQQGDDLIGIILNTIKSNPHIKELETFDILCIGQKIVSKAYGCIYKNFDEITPTDAARNLAKITGKPAEKVQMILDHAPRIVRIGKDLWITENENMLVGANSGIDFSNTEQPTYLHPDCDFIALQIRKEIHQRTGKKIGVIITDSIGRPFRFGSVGFAAGASGINVLEDKRGTKDIFGMTLQHTFIAIADQLATMADAVMGQCDEKIPAVVVRNAHFVSFNEFSKAKDLRRPFKEDTFIQFPWNYLFKYQISIDNNIDHNYELTVEELQDIVNIIIESMQLPMDFHYHLDKGINKNQFSLSIENCYDESAKIYLFGKISACIEYYFRGLGIHSKCAFRNNKLEIITQKPKNMQNIVNIKL